MANFNVFSGTNRTILNDQSNNVKDPVLSPELNSLYNRAMTAVSAGIAKTAKQYTDIDNVPLSNVKNTPLNLHSDENSVSYDR